MTSKQDINEMTNKVLINKMLDGKDSEGYQHLNKQEEGFYEEALAKLISDEIDGIDFKLVDSYKSEARIKAEKAYHYLLTVMTPNMELDLY